MVGGGSCNQWRRLDRRFHRRRICRLDGFFRLGADLGGWRIEQISLMRPVNTNSLAQIGLLGFSACSNAIPDRQGSVIFNRTGMGLFISDTQFRQKVDNRAGFDFQLPGKFVDSDFTHTLDVC